MKITRRTIARMLRAERATNRLMSARYRETNEQIRRKVYGNVRINHDGVTSLTLDPSTPGEYGDSTGDAFPPYAWPGGYTITYFTDDGSTLCAACAREAVLANGETVSADTYDEGPTVQCDGCNAVLESSYGDPDEEEDGEIMHTTPIGAIETPATA